MAVFRIEKTRDYTVMSNYHLRDRLLSLKAKGLLSLMLSLPEDWDYTMKGLARICKDGIDSISGGIRELERHGYLVRARVRNENGQLGSIEYTILEQPKEPAQTPAPIREKPIRENPIQVKPMLDAPIQENPAQLNTKEQNKELSITQGSSPIPSSPPSLQLHFVRLRPFRGQDVLTLDVAVHHEDGGGVIIHLPHDAGHGGKPRQLAAVPAPVSGDDLISAVLAGTDDSRDENAVLPDALRRFLHGFIVPYLERVVGEVVQLRQREQRDSILLRSRSGLCPALRFAFRFFHVRVPPVESGRNEKRENDRCYRHSPMKTTMRL